MTPAFFSSAEENPDAPTSHDVNHWLNFVIYAVLGQLDAADQLMVRAGPGIRRMAEWLGEQRPVQVGNLYRGILVEPDLLEDGRWLRHEAARRFLSYTDDLDVACWFANPRSIISEVVRDHRPRARGYLATAQPGRDRLLWHHEWVDIPLPGGRRIDLGFAAALHPAVDQRQFLWNVRTQGEVLVDAPEVGSRMKVEPMAAYCEADAEELDARFTFPPFLRSRYGA